jgi:hypothetical protein
VDTVTRNAGPIARGSSIDIVYADLAKVVMRIVIQPQKMGMASSHNQIIFAAHAVKLFVIRKNPMKSGVYNHRLPLGRALESISDGPVSTAYALL